MASYRQTGSSGYLFSIVLVAVLGGLLFGYDTAVISGAERGLQAFFMGAKDFNYTNGLHGFTSSSALIGCIIGSALSGLFAGKFGRKKSLFIAGICFFLSAAGSYCPEFLFFEKGVPTASLLVAFNLYRVLGGIGVGMASAICPMYIAEVAPADKRGTLVSWNQFAIIFGQLVVYFVNLVILGDHIAPKMESLAEGLNRIVNLGDLAADSNWSVTTGWRLMLCAHQQDHASGRLHRHAPDRNDLHHGERPVRGYLLGLPGEQALQGAPEKCLIDLVPRHLPYRRELRFPFLVGGEARHGRGPGPTTHPFGGIRGSEGPPQHRHGGVHPGEKARRQGRDARVDGAPHRS